MVAVVGAVLDAVTVGVGVEPVRCAPSAEVIDGLVLVGEPPPRRLARGPNFAVVWNSSANVRPSPSWSLLASVGSSGFG